MDIFLKKKYFNVENEECLSKEGMIAYVALKSVYRLDKDEHYLTLNSLLYEVYGSSCQSRVIRAKISEGLLELRNKKLIRLIQVTKSDFIIDLNKLYIECRHEEGKEQDYYVVIRDDEVHRIFNIITKHDKISILQYYINVIGSINYGTFSPLSTLQEEVYNFVGFMPIDYLAKISGINKNKAIEYNRILEMENLLFIYRANLYTVSENRIRYLRNHYGRYGDMEHIIAYAKKYIAHECSDYHEPMKSKEESNRKRSLKQIYNSMLNGKEYDIDVVKEVYRYIHACNEENKDIMNSTNDEYTIAMCMSGLMDESVFHKYGLPKKTEKDIWLELPDETPIYMDDSCDKIWMTKREYIDLFCDGDIKNIA